MRSTALVAGLFGALIGAALAAPASAQDIPGIENCVAEKQMDRRTSCLQSNINFLKSTITSEVGKARADALGKLDEAGRQIAALRLVISGLQDEIRKLRAEVDAAKQKPEPAKPAAK